MEKNRREILLLDSLEIGYMAHGRRSRLLPALSASAAGGELVALIGRNGIGKSTLLRTVLGLQPGLGGRVIIKGKDIIKYSRSDMARLTGYISTEIVRVANMRVYNLVALGRFPHTNWIGSIDAESHKVILESIRRTGIAGLQNRLIMELSDGERQKSMIARMIAQEAPIMVMDEPTAFLDIAARYDIINLLLDLTREGRTIVFSTHDINIAVNQADKIWLILEDRLVEGSPEDLMLNGAFDHLFDSSAVRFNPADGNFTFIKQNHGEISVRGKGPVRLWTEKALIRAGFSVVDNQMSFCVEAFSGAYHRWIVRNGSQSEKFYSIYDLVNYLKKLHPPEPKYLR